MALRAADQQTSRPLVLYDGACAFCRRWVERWRARTGERVAYQPSREPQLPAVELVDAGGRRFSGADAVFRVLGYAPGLRTIARLGRLPGVRALAAWVYRRIANHRTAAAKIDRVLFGRSTAPPTNALVRSVFSRALGGVYVIAFASLRAQVLGLYGERGIAPVRETLATIRSLSGARFRRAPTIFWLGASDRALVRATTAGQLCGALLLLGVARAPAAIGAWSLYRSFMAVGREFLAFQWDALLLESGLAGAIATVPRRDDQTPWPVVLLFRMLAFRLYFESGLCKLTSGDPSWRSGAACSYHFETQPLPTRLGWRAHQLPRRAQRFASHAVIGLELAVPWLAFAPRRIRRGTFVTLGLLQLAIAATGNYGFFNLLTVVDSLWLLDDEVLARRLHLSRPRVRRAARWRRTAVAALALPLLALAAADVVRRIRRKPLRSRALAWLDDALEPLASSNSYGLFSVMTTDRPEIVIEGSDDGTTWREYRFRHKPDDPRKPPRTTAPHQPRLDWHLWFAAMQAPPRWFYILLARLLEGSPAVLALFADNPFPAHPPNYVRALLYGYKMTDRATRRATGAWWHRELRGIYVPPCSARVNY